ncbi:hypothetical protein [Amycolatopsis sp. H20-H5]|uniref:hypothetical protein n=1 Tax=Amycolatopsis sp. H20-H5 TaxID=3046309 RepID=UPI002DB66D01|nr:hypothetical protein [Amycolatopsis sp. H20-H5]MEC3974985.1 hypothetical protein [Amycolatopsis sp. H20-H5]
MNMFRFSAPVLRKGLFVAAAAGLVSLVAPAAAGADQIHANDSGPITYYHDTNFNGQYDQSWPVAYGDCRSLDKPIGHAKSAVNNSYYDAVFWSDSKCKGKSYTLRPGESTSNFGFKAHGLGG